jgi:hypothetical protein
MMLSHPSIQPAQSHPYPSLFMLPVSIPAIHPNPNNRIPNKTQTNLYPPLSPNSLAQSSYSFKLDLLTLGRMVAKLATKSESSIGRISSIDMCSSASPSERSGPMAASFARAVMSEPENPRRKKKSAANFMWVKKTSRRKITHPPSTPPKCRYPPHSTYVAAASAAS